MSKMAEYRVSFYLIDGSKKETVIEAVSLYNAKEIILSKFFNGLYATYYDLDSSGDIMFTVFFKNICYIEYEIYQ